MNQNLLKRTEILTNVAVLIAAVLIGAAVVKNYILDRHDAHAKRPEETVIGSKLALPDVDWRANHQTLLLVLSRDCHYCSESAPFYKRLEKETARGNDTRLIAVLPQDVEQARSYLAELGLSVKDVRRASPGSLGVRGTPMIIVADDHGIVSHAWTGKLSPDEESDVLSKLDTGRVSACR